jgi:hypothetical protein
MESHRRNCLVGNFVSNEITKSRTQRNEHKIPTPTPKKQDIMSSFDSSSSSSSIQALALFRAALAINNCGVSILEKGRVREAQKTFREALILMKHASCNPTAAACQGISETLHTASARLVRAQKSPVHAVVFEICAMEDGNDDLSSIKSSLHYGPSSSIVFPIRIRSTADAVQDDDIQQNLEMNKRHMAILLYNHGLAHLLWGQCAIMSQTTLQQKHYSSALSCLHVAQAVISQHLAREQQQDDDPFQKQCSLIVQALVVNSLVQVMHVQNQLGLCIAPPCQASTSSSSQSSLDEWIQVQSNVLKECDSMDRLQQAVLLATSHPAATAA